MVLTILLGLIGCATVVRPSGGPKDETPPSVLKSKPENFSKLFTGQEIQITFDEFISLSDISNQLVISPPIENKPNVVLKGKTVRIHFEDKLKEETTYTLNFGNAIKDFTEGNVLENYKFVFATGNVLDSLSVSGHVTDAYEGENTKGALVLLYKDNALYTDSVPYKNIPDYFSKTNADGLFEISNIAEGQYHIFALMDENSNYLYDINTEKIAFLDGLIQPADSSSLALSVFQETNDIVFLGGINSSYGQIKLSFSKAPEQLDIQMKGEALNLIPDMRMPQDSIICWVNPEGVDSVQLYLKTNQNIIDTAKISFRKFAAKIFTPIYEGGRNLNPSELPKITADIPFDITENTINQIQLLEGDALVPFTIQKENDFSFQIDFEKKEDKNYQLKCYPEAFRDIFGNTNDSLSFEFRTGLANEFANLQISLEHNNKSAKIVELLNNKKVLIKKLEIRDEKTVSFDMLTPGSYMIRIIEDLNENHKWDSGNYLDKLQAEKVYYFGQEIKLRANWDFEIDMVLD